MINRELKYLKDSSCAKNVFRLGKKCYLQNVFSYHKYFSSIWH